MTAQQFSIIVLVSCSLALCFTDCHSASVTYPGIGTFTDRDFYDATWRPLVMLPQSPQVVDPTYMLYNREIPHTPEKLHFNGSSKYYKSTHFNPKLETKIIVHGFVDNTLIGHWMQDMKDKFLKIQNYNVIIVDWGKANFFPYTQATANSRMVGAMTGILVQNLCKTFGISESSFHALGHSLGAHVVGYIGKWCDGKLGHITGFDPAGPYFEGLKETAARLWHTDALFVESIHTDAHHLIPDIGLGMYETCSHVDIYPNGGVKQPGCDQERITTIITKGLVDGIRKLVACNHQRSTEFYFEAILDAEASPVAYECESYQSFQEGKCTSCGKDGSKCVTLGPKSLEYQKFIKNPKKSRGKRYFMSTAEHEKFFKYQYLVKINMAKESSEYVAQHGKISLKLADSKGFGQYFDFNHEDQIFHYGTTYSKVIVSEMEPAHLKEVQLKWSHGMNLFKWTMHIHSLDIVPLSDKVGSHRTLKHAKFVTKDDAITNKQEYTFKLSR